MKHCTRCGELKELSGFYFSGKYLRAECKPCTRTIKNARWQKPTPEESKRVQRHAERMREKPGSYRIIKIFNSVKYGARARGLSFTIAKSDIAALLERQQWKCARTDIPFDLTMGSGMRPFGPTVDRIDNTRGYEPDNIQVVCNIYNMAKRDFSEDVVMRFAKALLTNAQA